MTTPWRIDLLGQLRAERGDQVVTHFRTQKAGMLLAYLAYYPQRPHRREALVELLWPASDPEAGRNRLKTELAALRRQLEPPGVPAGTVLIADRASVRLNPEAIITDVADFQAPLHAAKRSASSAEQTEFFARAVERCPGELLPGYFEDWILQERQWLSEQYFAALAQLLAHLERAGEIERALEYARQGVRVDPLREEAHLDLLRLQVAAGHPEAALRQYEELARLMEEQLGAEPSAEVQVFAEEIRSQAQSAGRARAKFPSPPADAAPIGNLPFRLTRFFGRKPEIARLRALLQTKGTRLVTLTGPGGSGKTRLALESVGRLRKVWPGGIWFVPLQDLTDPQLIPAAVLDALRVPRAGRVEPVEQLVTVLWGQPRLLVLDNFEHLVGGGASLVWTLLERVAPLTVLVTSRQRLGLPGERQFPVPPLPVPAVSGQRSVVSRDERAPSALTTDHRSLTTIPSVRLFVDRAQAVRPEFEVTAANAAAVAKLCTRLEGLPLAIELAAARIGVVTPEQMLAWLEQRFEFLVSRERQADRRHQSLRVALDGSFQLLTPELQRFFARLSVFRGGWTVGAAEAVCIEPRALAYLEQLQECSLVLAEETSVGRGGGGGPGGVPTGAGIRFRLLETIQEYARDRLLEAGETANARGCHREYYLQWAEQSQPGFPTGASQTARLDRLEAEHGNLRVALAWTIERGEADAALRLANSLCQLWSLRGYLTEGRERLAAVLALPGAQAHTEARASALNGAGNLALEQGDHPGARAFYEEALVIWRELGNQWYVIGVLHNLGVVSRRQGDYARARACFEENLARWRSLDEKGGIAATLGNLAEVARGEGDYDQAAALARESLVLAREAGEASLVCPALQILGRAVQHHGDHTRAAMLFRESLALNPEGGSLPAIAGCLSGLAGVAEGEGHPHWAARLLGAAVALLDRMGAVLSAADRAENDRCLAALRSALGEAAFAAAWAEGCEMPLESAIALALAEP